MVGGPFPGEDRAVSGNVTATDSSGQRFSAMARDGNFALELPPGVYNAVGHSPDFGYGKYDCSAGGPVIVLSRPAGDRGSRTDDEAEAGHPADVPR